MEHLPMNPQFKKPWVEGLRSGKFNQGREVLKYQGDIESEDEYCCLGVLCHIAGIEFTSEGYDGDESLLTKDLLEKFKLEDHTQNLLSSMNDGAGIFSGAKHSFAQIADWIDTNL